MEELWQRKSTSEREPDLELGVVGGEVLARGPRERLIVRTDQEAVHRSRKRHVRVAKARIHREKSVGQSSHWTDVSEGEDRRSPPGSPLLEAYHGTYQSISPMPSPLLRAQAKKVRYRVGPPSPHVRAPIAMETKGGEPRSNAQPDSPRQEHTGNRPPTHSPHQITHPVHEETVPETRIADPRPDPVVYGLMQICRRLDRTNYLSEMVLEGRKYWRNNRSRSDSSGRRYYNSDEDVEKGKTPVSRNDSSPAKVPLPPSPSSYSSERLLYSESSSESEPRIRDTRGRDRLSYRKVGYADREVSPRPGTPPDPISSTVPIPEAKRLEEHTIRRQNLNAHEVFPGHDFSKPERMLTLYPLRYRINNMPPQDLNELAQLCDELKLALYETVLSDWPSIPAFAALVEERILCCTGDPALRLDACWDRRPRGTLLDFGWTRAAPQIPIQWEFFAHCSPTTLVSILIEVTEAVKIKAELATEFRSATAQAWKTITPSDVLRRCYCRGLLAQPAEGDFEEYTRHVFYVLAAIETTNIFFKSPRVDIPAIAKAVPDPRSSPSQLLKVPISSIINSAMLSVADPYSRRGSRIGPRGIYLVDTNFPPALQNEVFPPQHLNFQTLMKLGSLKIQWTECLDDHLLFNASLLIVKIYWFASHIESKNNESYHLYCDSAETSCQAHAGKFVASRSPYYVGPVERDFALEVTNSYKWLFAGLATGSSVLQNYYDLPLPWWLRPFDKQDLSSDSTGRQNSDLSAELAAPTNSRLKRVLNYIIAKLGVKDDRKHQEPTIRTLLHDSLGVKCKLPSDCSYQMKTIDCNDVIEPLDSTPIPYSRYPILATRIKLLNDYMERQKPRGFLALWRDKRDSNSWYTFWAAVIFGLSALMLALAGLAVSSAQTWAAFRALELQIASTPQTTPATRRFMVI